MDVNKKTSEFIEQHKDEDVKHLALRSSALKDIDAAFALSQIAGYQMMRKKVPFWANINGILYPKHISLEQCSSEKTAKYKVNVVRNLSERPKIFADLTAGFGIDFFFLSEFIEKGFYLERQEELSLIAEHNFRLLGAENVVVKNQDCVEFLKGTVPLDFLLLDPARRSPVGKKVVFIEDCEPNVLEIMPLLLEKSKVVMIKFSPMLDIHSCIEKIKHIKEIHILAVGNECKELLLIISRDYDGEPQIFCVNDNHSFSFCLKEEKDAVCSFSEDVKEYLYEPNVSLLKAGAFNLLSTRYKLEKLNPNSHLYTSDILVEDFPGRVFKKRFVSGFGKRELYKISSEIKKANLTIRNFPSSVADLRKKMKIKEGGEDYIFATTLFEGEHVLICCSKA